MCGRFTLRTGLDQLAEQFLVSATGDVELRARYNIAPTQPVAAVRAGPGDGRRELVLLRWGLVPAWAKDPAIGSRLINARAETAAEKPSFRGPFRRRRCLILADGYYEWQPRGPRAAKQPFWITLRDERPFGMAGLWDRWQAPDGAAIESCVVLTTEANALTRAIHDRMPVILRPEDHAGWLDPQFTAASDLAALLLPYAAEAMLTRPVSTLVNNPRNDSPACVAAIQEDAE